MSVLCTPLQTKYYSYLFLYDKQCVLRCVTLSSLKTNELMIAVEQHMACNYLYQECAYIT